MPIFGSNFPIRSPDWLASRPNDLGKIVFSPGAVAGHVVREGLGTVVRLDVSRPLQSRFYYSYLSFVNSI